MAATLVGELELDLDAFEGPFDLLLSLVLRDELPLREVDLAEIVVAFVERLAERDELDLDACGEFLVLISALLELKARALFPDEEAELAELEPEEAAEELARRLAEYRRAKEGAAWLAERLDGGARPLLPARPGAARARAARAARSPRRSRRSSPTVLRLLAVEPPAPSTAHMALRFPPVAQFVERWRVAAAPPLALRLRPGGRRALARRGRGRVPRAARAVASRASSRSRRRRRSRR